MLRCCLVAEWRRSVWVRERQLRLPHGSSVCSEQSLGAQQQTIGGLTYTFVSLLCFLVSSRSHSNTQQAPAYSGAGSPNSAVEASTTAVTIPLPSGSYNSLNVLGAATNSYAGCVVAIRFNADCSRSAQCIVDIHGGLHRQHDFNVHSRHQR